MQLCNVCVCSTVCELLVGSLQVTEWALASHWLRGDGMGGEWGILPGWHVTVLTRWDKDCGRTREAPSDVSFYVQDAKGLLFFYLFKIRHADWLKKNKTEMWTSFSDARLRARAHSMLTYCPNTLTLCHLSGSKQSFPIALNQIVVRSSAVSQTNTERAARTRHGHAQENMPQHVTACPNTYLGPPPTSSPPTTTISSKDFLLNVPWCRMCGH